VRFLNAFALSGPRKSAFGVLWTSKHGTGTTQFALLITNTFGRYLKSPAVNADLPNLNFLLPDAKPDTGVFVLDTSDLFAALEGEGGHNRRSLERVCRHLQVPTSFLHNAGNDAHVCSDLSNSRQG
jgi:hypothetical protein